MSVFLYVCMCVFIRVGVRVYVCEGVYVSVYMCMCVSVCV